MRRACTAPRPTPYQSSSAVASASQEVDDREEEREDSHRVDVRVEVVLVQLVELAELARFAVEQLHDQHARQVLLQEGVDPRQADALLAVGGAHPALEHWLTRAITGSTASADQRQPPVEQQHDDDDADQRHQVARHRDHARADELVQRVHVVGQAADQPAHRVAVEVAERLVLQVGEDLQAQVVHHLLADHLHQVVLRVAEHEAQHKRAKV